MSPKITKGDIDKICPLEMPTRRPHASEIVFINIHFALWWLRYGTISP